MDALCNIPDCLKPEFFDKYFFGNSMVATEPATTNDNTDYEQLTFDDITI